MFNLFKYFKKSSEIIGPNDVVTDAADLSKEKKAFIYFDSISLKLLIMHDMEIVSVEEIFFGPYENLEEGEVVRDLPKVLLRAVEDLKLKIFEIKEISISLSMDNVITKNLQVINIDKYEALLLAEIKKYIPIPFNEVMIAKNKINLNIKNKLMFFCIVIQKSLFEKYISIFKIINSNPYIEVGFFSLVRLFPEEVEQSINLTVNINNNDSIFIASKGKVILDIKRVNFGIGTIIHNLKKEFKISNKDSVFLIENLDKLLLAGKASAKSIEKHINNFEDMLEAEIAQSVIIFEKDLGLEISNLNLMGDFKFENLKVKLKNRYDANLKINILDFRKENMNLNRYTHNLGIAKAKLKFIL